MWSIYYANIKIEYNDTQKRGIIKLMQWSKRGKEI